MAGASLQLENGALVPPLSGDKKKHNMNMQTSITVIAYGKSSCPLNGDFL